MRIAVEAVGNRSGGGFAVLVRTMRAIAADDRVSRIDVFCSPPEALAEQLPDISGVRWHPSEDHVAFRVAWYERGFARACNRVEADVALCLNGLGRVEIGAVSVVQQALALAPQSRAVSIARAARLRLIRSLLLSACRASNAVVVQTRWMGEAVVKNLGMRPNVLPLGLIPHEGGMSDRGEFVVGMGGRLPYKNAGVLRQAMRRCEADDFTVFGHPARPFEEVKTAMQRARVTIVPSCVESFGLPLVEAFAFDSAVVVADRPYARDVCDNAALYFDSDDPIDAADRIDELLYDDALREDLLGRGRRRLEHLWEMRPYERLVDLLEEAA